MDNIQIPDGYTYLRVVNQEQNQLTVRIKEVTDEASARVWLKKLSEGSYVTWRVSKTFPDAGRKNLFMLHMRCQHNTTSQAVGKCVRAVKNTNCPAKLYISVRRIVRHSRCKDAKLESFQYPCVVRFHQPHNHSIIDPSVLQYRDVGPETRAALLALFQRGHSVATALHCYKINLLLELGEEFNRVSADRKYIPSSSIAQKLRDKECGKDVGVVSDADLFTRLCELVGRFGSEGGKIKVGLVGTNQFYFATCTPLMSRTHRLLPQSSEVVVVHRVTETEKKKHCVYILSTPTATGCVPLGIIITSSEDETVFQAGVQGLKECFPVESFHGQLYPAVFRTDNDSLVRRTLKHEFSASRLELSDHYILRTVRTWLSESSHNIPSIYEQQELYCLFQSMVYAKSEAELVKMYEVFENSTLVLHYPRFRQYVQGLWQSRTDWSICYRVTQIGCPSNSFREIIFRWLSDHVFHRTRSFNMLQLADFILTTYETYLNQRLLDYCNGKYNKTFVQHILPSEHSVDEADVFSASDSGVFAINCTQSSEVYNVDITCGFCSCSAGQGAKLCRHVSCALLYLDVGLSCRSKNEELKRLFRQVAVGSDGNELTVLQNFNNRAALPSMCDVSMCAVDSSASTDVSDKIDNSSYDWYDSGRAAADGDSCNASSNGRSRDGTASTNSCRRGGTASANGRRGGSTASANGRYSSDIVVPHYLDSDSAAAVYSSKRSGKVEARSSVSGSNTMANCDRGGIAAPELGYNNVHSSADRCNSGGKAVKCRSSSIIATIVKSNNCTAEPSALTLRSFNACNANDYSNDTVSYKSEEIKSETISHDNILGCPVKQFHYCQCCVRSEPRSLDSSFNFHNSSGVGSNPHSTDNSSMQSFQCNAGKVQGLLDCLQQFADRVTDGVSTDPSRFIPAVTEFKSNYEQHVMTDNDLIQALGSFAKPFFNSDILEDKVVDTDNNIQPIN